MSEDQIQPEPRRRRPDNVQGDAPDQDRPRRRRRRDDDDDDDDSRFRKPNDIEMLIPYRNPMGLTAYYLGVFSLIPCLGLLLGPAALITGCLGLNYKKKHPTAGGSGHAIAGIVLGAVTSLGNWGVVGVGVLAALFG